MGTSCSSIPTGSKRSSTAHPERTVSATSTQWVYDVDNGGIAGTWQVQVVNADGQASNTGSFLVTAPPPSISNVSPATMPASTSAPLTVTGSNFSTSGGYLLFTDPFGLQSSSASDPGRIVSVTSTRWVYDLDNGGEGGFWSVQVVNADGQVSDFGTFLVTGSGLPPSISSVSPATVPASTTIRYTLVITGSNFSIGGYLLFTDPDGLVSTSSSGLGLRGQPYRVAVRPPRQRHCRHLAGQSRQLRRPVVQYRHLHRDPSAPPP